MKYKILFFLLLLAALPASADRRKKKSVSKPDSIPALAQFEALEPSDTVDFYLDSLITLEIDSLVEEELSSGIRHNINTASIFGMDTWEGRLQHQLDSLCNTGMFETSQLGLYVYDITAGNDIYAVNYRHRMRPASCQKLVTSISALHFLGGNYQFKTDLRITGEVEDSVLKGDVYVKGCMDPMLSQGDVHQLALSLRKEGIDSIAGNLYVDLSFKDDNGLGWGWCWDDDYGPMRVLTVNGKDRFEREFVDDLKSAGIRLANEVMSAASSSSKARSLYTAQHSIDQILLRMMKNSDNIYAESLFYQVAAYGGHREAGRKHAASNINSLISKIGLKPSNYTIADGSGLSLYNYLTPQLLVRLLTFAWNNEGIRNHLYPSLPIAGRDGTLGSRMSGTAAKGNVHAKTGTVSGVSSLSGYATSPQGHVLAFSIINQGIASSSTGRKFQDKVCRLLCED